MKRKVSWHGSEFNRIGDVDVIGETNDTTLARKPPDWQLWRIMLGWVISISLTLK